MLDIVINGKTYTYLNSVKINDTSYLSYTDGNETFISCYYYDGNNIVINEIDEATFLEVMEIIK